MHDTLKTVVRTDTGVYIKMSYLLNGLETCEELRKARGEGETEPFERSAYGYDTLGHKILVIKSQYNRFKKDFEHVSKEEFEYDENNNPKLSTLYSENRSGWHPEQRLGRTFDSRGNVTSLETYEPNGNDWVIRTKSYFKYDNNNLVIEKTDFRADSLGEWHPEAKAQRVFNKTLLVEEIISEPAPGNKWAQKSKAEFEYNYSNQCTKSTSYIFRGGKWVNYVQSEYTFDAAGNMLECNTYFWNEKSGRWSFHDKEEF